MYEERRFSWATPPLTAWSRRGIHRRPPYAAGRRFVIVHLDGLSRATLEYALENGYMPRLASALERGEQVLARAHAGAPASTPAFQAALFYGKTGDIPGYIWHDKVRGKNVRMDSPVDCARFEASLQGPRPALLAGGSTYCSIISGDASAPCYAMSKLARGFPWLPFGCDDEMNGWDHLASIVAHTAGLTTSAGMMAATAITGAWNSAVWALQKGRLKHEPRFLLNRMLLGELAVQLTSYFTLLDIARGVPAIYSVYAGYDENAHRRGPYSYDALSELTIADERLAQIRCAIRARPELQYELYVLADHGQEPTRPIEEVLSGPNLADWILSANRSGKVEVEHAGRRASERLRRERLSALPFCHDLCAGAIRDGGGEDGKPPVVVADAGDVAHVYFTDTKRSLSLDELLARWPAQARATLECPGSGIVAVRGGRAGFAFLRGRRFDLAEPGSLEGVLPYDGERLRGYLSEMVAKPSAGDLVVFGAGVEGGDVAFAYEFGSHGGVGVGDVETFVIHPWFVDFDGPAVKGPLDLHRFFTERYLPSHGDES
ncbi:putative membrane protein [Vulgatibacter incomptus]|uniref:Putative membrane protein n=1 Tax=Vulgatibacter incomptus TaxID=1391653 RepID=A0A0K1P8Q5_9BACT|nr:putative membrane protein [Vulgatibacter incomptus]